ncbi:MAG: DUF1272 domain-containing protein [Candidatus Eremiobacteraeota bacterium]|nr:DUF1272 domain-containing protein [Candidatus Eremiobacteraeota bacterium]MBV8434437.1 DUF1272 domain-containing protein [Candidatus Eremiobacteraeota bacterium]MBV8584216.1 DUF1272 domain-containing protein [Candidatus Eremiobacteraeota bacterium]MBV8720906.1 DUF1272 domain-containing protein [Candidatus Eremiobacteraeota bacterium]
MQLRQSPPVAEEADFALTYRFGPYFLDVAHRRLFSGSDVKTLPEKPFQVLTLLLEADGKVVERHTFFERLWPGDPVGDANLTQHIFMLRGLLGEHGGDNEYVLTVPGKGYRLAMPSEKKLGLAMKGSCERCGRVLKPLDEAYICSYECTFCPVCSDAMARICPNCGGEQVARPRR